MLKDIYDVRSLCKAVKIHHSVYYYHKQNKENSYKKANEELEKLRKEIEEKGYPPSVREIGRAVGLSSTATVHCYLKKLEELGFDTLNILFDGNPYILNLDDYEIENYIKKREDKGELLEDIVDDMSSNPYIFQEI